MNGYTNSELADMHLMYGRAHGNSRAAKRLYGELFPNRRQPGRKMFVSIDRRLRETGKFVLETVNRGRPRTTLTPAVEEEILDLVAADPCVSTRGVSNTLEISHSLVWGVLNEQLLHPYHLQRVQGLSPNDYASRFDFSQWFAQKIAINPNFMNLVLFTDEAGFNRNGIINFHNNHLWAEENPHAFIQSRHQQHFHVNVWAGIVGDELIGPYFLPNRLTGNLYLHFLENDLPNLLENVSLLTRHHMWFMHDGAPPHFSLPVRQYLQNLFRDQWIGRGGPTTWPPRSPDLNPLDFYFWGHLKSLVYTMPINNVDDLRQRIIDCCNSIKQKPGIFERVRQSMRRRLECCMQVQGGHFEQLL